MSNQENKAFPTKKINYNRSWLKMPWASFSLHMAPGCHFWDRLQCPPPGDPKGPRADLLNSVWVISVISKKGGKWCVASINSASAELQKALFFLRCPSKEGICQLASLHIYIKKGIYGGYSNFLLPSHFGFQTKLCRMMQLVPKHFLQAITNLHYLSQV